MLFQYFLRIRSILSRKSIYFKCSFRKFSEFDSFCPEKSFILNASSEIRKNSSIFVEKAFILNALSEHFRNSVHFVPKKHFFKCSFRYFETSVHFCSKCIYIQCSLRKLLKSSPCSLKRTFILNITL